MLRMGKINKYARRFYFYWSYLLIIIYIEGWSFSKIKDLAQKNVDGKKPEDESRKYLQPRQMYY